MIIIIAIILLILITFVIKYNKEGFDNSITKIIHQTAPNDKSKWPDLWYKCQESWKKMYPNYKYKLWSDEDLDELIKTQYPEFYDIYINYDINMKRIDMARYFILYTYGGVYVDMDFICFKPFLDSLPQDKVSIVESPWDNETLQNSLMISPKHNPFWLKVIEKAKSRVNDDILKSTGPILISDTYFENKEMIHILPNEFYNPKNTTSEVEYTPNDKLITLHYGTKTW